MIKTIQTFFERYRWSWVGTAVGETLLTDANGQALKTGSNRSAYWNLYQRGDGKRHYQEIGDVFRWYASQSCRKTKAQVDAWKFGGPLPPLLDLPGKPKNKGELIVFPGGKDSD